MKVSAALIAAAAAFFTIAGVAAAPAEYKREDSTYTITVVNNCAATKNVVALQQINGAINTISRAVALTTGASTAFTIPFTDTGVKISVHAEYSNQWQVQSLAEFGYAAGWSGGPSAGTAYDVSVMTGSIEGVTIVPSDTSCETKACPDVNNCPADQGWTNADQVNQGSPADTVCYNGAPNFTVTFSD